MSRSSVFIICSTIIILSIPCISTTAFSDLLENISRNHNSLCRPASSSVEFLNITVRFIPKRVNNFDEIAGHISFAMAFDFRWKDDTLKWNPGKYSNITNVVLPEDQIWTPSMALANPADRSILFPEDEFDVRVYFTGDVVWVKAGTVTTTCKPFVKYYPFDVHTCSVKLFPMSHIITEIILHRDLKMDVFDNFGQWFLFNEQAVNENLDVFSVVSFDFSIKRQPEFSLLSLCVPILFLGILNACVFLIPPSSGERISYAITVLLSFAVFMTIISANMPKNSDPVPILCYVLMAMMAESGLIVFLTIYGLRLSFRSEQRPIPRLWRIFNVRQFRSKCNKQTNVFENNSPKADVDNFGVQTEPPPSWSSSCYGKCASWQEFANVYDKCCFWASFVAFLGTVIWYIIAVKRSA